MGMQIRRVARSTVVEFMAYCHRSFLFARRTASRVFIDRRAPTAGNRLSPPPISLDHETFKFARRSREKKGEGEKKKIGEIRGWTRWLERKFWRGCFLRLRLDRGI